MGKSARILGEAYNLNAQEMNYILNKEGFLDGEPGDYFPSEMGKQYATQKDFHRGTGGYAHYNRYWTTTTWDDSIEDALHITPELKAEARKAIADRRQMQAEARRAASEAAEQRFREAQENFQAAISNNADSDESSNGINGWVVAGGALLLAAGVYGVYKAAPHVKHWWDNKVVPFFSRKDTDDQEE